MDAGYGKPETRRLPYNDFGIFIIAGRGRWRRGQQTVNDGVVRREPAGLRCGRVRPHQPRRRPTRSTSRCSPPTRTRRRSPRSSPRTTDRRDGAPDHLADRDPQRGRQPRVRYPGGRQPGPRQRSHGGDPDVGVQSAARTTSIQAAGSGRRLMFSERRSLIFQKEYALPAPSESAMCFIAPTNTDLKSHLD